MSVEDGPVLRDDEALRRLLSSIRRVALVGASPNPARASNYVMAYLQSRGVRVIPVNPGRAGETINGEVVAARLADVPPPVDLVDVFRNSVAAGAAVDDAIAARDSLGIRGVWLQSGVINAPAARRAAEAGLSVVMDRCIKVEWARLEIGSITAPT